MPSLKKIRAGKRASLGGRVAEYARLNFFKANQKTIAAFPSAMSHSMVDFLRLEKDEKGHTQLLLEQTKKGGALKKSEAADHIRLHEQLIASGGRINVRIHINHVYNDGTRSTDEGNMKQYGWDGFWRESKAKGKQIMIPQWQKTDITSMADFNKYISVHRKNIRDVAGQSAHAKREYLLQEYGKHTVEDAARINARGVGKHKGELLSLNHTDVKTPHPAAEIDGGKQGNFFLSLERDPKNKKNVTAHINVVVTRKSDLKKQKSLIAQLIQNTSNPVSIAQTFARQTTFAPGNPANKKNLDLARKQENWMESTIHPGKHSVADARATVKEFQSAKHVKMVNNDGTPLVKGRKPRDTHAIARKAARTRKMRGKSSPRLNSRKS